MHLYFFPLLVPMGERVHNCFLGLGKGLCCSSIYGVKQNIAPNDKVPFYVLIDYALFLLFCL